MFWIRRLFFPGVSLSGAASALLLSAGAVIALWQAAVEPASPQAASMNATMLWAALMLLYIIASAPLRISNRTSIALPIADAAFVAVLALLTGGPRSPYRALFLIPALEAMTQLEPVLAAVGCLLIAAAYFMVSLDGLDIGSAQEAAHNSLPVVACSLFVALFLAQRARETRLLKFERERNESMLTCADHILAAAVSGMATPLKYLASLVKLVEGERSPRKLKLHVSGMVDEVAKLQGMLSQLAQVTVLRASKMPLQPVNVQEIACVVAGHLRPEAPFNVVAVKADEPAPWVVADPDRLRLVLRNLLSEALSASPPGTEVNTEITNGSGLVKIRILSGVFSDVPESGSRPDLLLHASSDDSSLCNQSMDLAVAASLMQVQGGTMKVSMTNGSSLCFSLTMPAYGSARRKKRVQSSHS